MRKKRILGEIQWVHILGIVSGIICHLISFKIHGEWYFLDGYMVMTMAQLLVKNRREHVGALNKNSF